MALKQDFRPLALEDLIPTCKEFKEKGYRLTQITPKLESDDTITLIYTFVMAADVINFKVSGIVKDETEVPSVTPYYIACFVNENEAHDLFGVDIVGNVIDFEGTFYRFAEDVEAPMTIVSPAQLAAREKAAKLAAAKAARAAKAAKAAEPAAPAADAALEAKLAGMDPEKAAKVRAAMEAKARRKAAEEAKAAEPAAPAVNDALEEKLAGMDPEKAAKVRAAMEAKARRKAQAEKGGE